ncbi:reverse transcriptase domain-containing protein [Tanacetum coccineum]|uniref:Reverse transcriptase domain-containing protein n=1 Tax=Tanacetum coccineum TaxID=301880 RepID=A0ABQ4ZJV5_9ASTR
MADNRTMAQMLQAPIEGYEDAIVVPPINANNFELKQTLINLVQSEARTWLDKEPPRSILTWDDLVSKFINQFFPPSKTTYLRNEITTFLQKPNETFNEAWERFKGFLRQCPHHGFSELHQLDTFYNSLNTNDQDALDSAAGGNFLDKMPRDGLAIIESKSKVRYSRSRAIEPRVSTNAPLSTSTPSNSFEFQQLAASLEDKMDIRMSRLEKMISEKNVTTPATVKAVEEVCVTCGSNHNFNNCPLTRNEFPVFHDNIHQFQQTAAVGNFVQRNPPNLANQMRPPGQVYQPPTIQPPVLSKLLLNKCQGVSKIDLENYVKDIDAVLRNWKKSRQGNKEKYSRRSPLHPVIANVPSHLHDKVPENNRRYGKKFLIPCALQELDRTSALADSGASINLLPHSIYKQLGLGALTPTRMTLELANRSITHPMGIAEDVVVRVDGRPFLRTAKALIDLYEEKLTLRVGSDEFVFYAENSEKSKNKQFAHAISVIDFSKDEPFSGSTTNHSDALPPSSSPVKTSDNLEEFADELTLSKKDVHFQVYSIHLFEFDDNFTSSNEMVEDVVNKNSNVSDEPVLLNTPLTDKVECSDPEDDIDEIDAFLAMEVSSDFEEGYFDSEGDITFLDNLLSDDLAPEVISDHEPEQNESSITFSPRSDPLHHEFAEEIITLPLRIVHKHEDYLNRMTLLCEISISRSQGEMFTANQKFKLSSSSRFLLPRWDSDPFKMRYDIFSVPDDLIPPGVENDDSEDEDNELPNLDHQDDPSIPRPPPEPPDVEKCLEPEAGILITKVFKGVSKPHDFMADILPTLPTLVSDLTFILFLSSFLSFGSEDTVFDPGISTFHFSLKPVPFALPKDE